MVKNHLILFYLSMSTLLTDSYAQTGNFDIVNYQSSEFFTQSELPSRVQFEYAKIQAQITWLTSIKDRITWHWNSRERCFPHDCGNGCGGPHQHD